MTNATITPDATSEVADRQRQLAFEAWQRIKAGAQDPVAEIVAAIERAFTESCFATTVDRVLALAVRLGRLRAIDVVRHLGVNRMLADSALLRLHGRGQLVRVVRGVYEPSTESTTNIHGKPTA